MCIIAIKPVGIDLPTEERLEKMWNSNKDGAGIAFVFEGKVYLEKGFMTKDDFDKRWEELQKEYDLKNMLVAIHMRVKTAGAIDPAKCHPFPISDKDEELDSLKYKGNRVIFHNGTISDYKEYGTKALSDSQNFIKKVIKPIQDLDSDWFDNAHWATIAERILGKSRIAVINEDSSFRLFGEGWILEAEDGGIWYSNEYYSKERKKRVVTYSSSSYYDNDYYNGHYGSSYVTKYKRMSCIAKGNRNVYISKKIDGTDFLEHTKDPFGAICVDKDGKYYVYSSTGFDYVLKEDIVVRTLDGKDFKYKDEGAVSRKYRDK